MALVYDSGSTRPRIKGTDPRVREVADRIGRGYQPTADAFAERIARQAAENPEPVNPSRQPPSHERRTFYHESDEKNWESLRDKGILAHPDPADPEGARRVFASDYGGAEPRVPPHGRVRVTFTAPESEIADRGTGTSHTVSLRNSIRPEDITAIHGIRGGGLQRFADAGSGVLGLMSLLGTAANFIPGFSERMPRTAWLANGGPLGDVLNYAIGQNYAPGGIMDPYRDMRDMPGFNPQTGTVPA